MEKPTKINKLLDEYALSHQNRSNVIIHKFFVPLIMWSVIGLLYAIPVPESFRASGFDWALLGTAMALGYYFVLSKKYFAFMLPIIMLMYFLVKLCAEHASIFWVSLAVFVFSWVMQFVGHKIEGKKPSFLKDLLFLLIGPLWVAKSLFRLR